MVDLSIGDSASMSKVIAESDVFAFAEVSGDRNPVHLDPEYASRTQFSEPIAHGMLVASLISAVLATKLPGPGSIYLNQVLRFKAPVFFGDEITARVEVTKMRSDKPIVELETHCTNQDGTVVIEGEAVLMVPPDPEPG